MNFQMHRIRWYCLLWSIYNICWWICVSGQSVEERHHYNHYPSVAGQLLIPRAANPFMYVHFLYCL